MTPPRYFGTYALLYAVVGGQWQLWVDGVSAKDIDLVESVVRKHFGQRWLFAIRRSEAAKELVGCICSRDEAMRAKAKGASA